MLDVAVAYNRYKFLGEEFLTWLWYVIENDQNLIKNFDKDFVALEVGNRIVFENRRNDSDERITIKGDRANLEEGILALKKGGLVTELNMIYRSGEFRWQFTVKGESLNISSLITPKTDLPPVPGHRSPPGPRGRGRHGPPDGATFAGAADSPDRTPAGWHGAPSSTPPGPDRP